MLATTLVSLGVLLGYLGVFFSIFHIIPSSLSDTYYHYEGLCKGSGIAFVLSLMVISMSIAPSLFIASEGHPLQFLGFFTVAGLLFVGAAPRFRDVGMESIIHPVAAIICALSCMIWIIFVARAVFTIVISLIIVGILAVVTKSYRCYTFWLEMIAFMSIFVTLLLI